MLFANVGKPARPTKMVAMVYDLKTQKYITRAQWEQQRVEAEAQAKRMEKEPFDYTYKAPSSQKLPYDFSQ
jgi:hypothetical protein